MTHIFYLLRKKWNFILIKQLMKLNIFWMKIDLTPKWTEKETNQTRQYLERVEIFSRYVHLRIIFLFICYIHWKRKLIKIRRNEKKKVFFNHY